MRTFAEIYKEKVIAIHNTPDDFNVDFSLKSFRFAVDVTGENPQPQSGWIYNFDTGEFAAPDPVKKSVIPIYEFWDRFTQTEKKTLINSTDPEIATYRFDVFRTRQTINLEDPKTVAAITYLENNCLVDAGRASEILAIEQV